MKVNLFVRQMTRDVLEIHMDIGITRHVLFLLTFSEESGRHGHVVLFVCTNKGMVLQLLKFSYKLSFGNRLPL